MDVFVRLIIAIVILIMWLIMVFCLGYPSISMTVNRMLKKSFIFYTMVLETGGVIRSWASPKDLVWKRKGIDYVITEEFLKNRHGLWYEGITQQIKWPGRDFENLKEPYALDARAATAVYHSKIAEALNLIRNDAKLKLMLLLLFAIVGISALILLISWMDYIQTQQAIKTGMGIIQTGGNSYTV